MHALQRGDRRGAAERFREAAALLAPALGEDHPYSLAIASNLASVTADQSEQEALYRRLIEVQSARMGDGSKEVATAWNNLGGALARRGRMGEALAAFRAALRAGRPCSRRATRWF